MFWKIKKRIEWGSLENSPWKMAHDEIAKKILKIFDCSKQSLKALLHPIMYHTPFLLMVLAAYHDGVAVQAMHPFSNFKKCKY